jgi:fatty-acyl-CoA synthase
MQVFGVPDPKVGEEVCVYLRVREGVQLSEADIVQYCRDKVRDSAVLH